MDLHAAKCIGAGIAVIPLFGVGIGLGNIFSSLITSIARNPEIKNDLFNRALLAFALTESVAIFSLLIAILILFAI